MALRTLSRTTTSGCMLVMRPKRMRACSPVFPLSVGSGINIGWAYWSIMRHRPRYSNQTTSAWRGWGLCRGWRILCLSARRLSVMNQRIKSELTTHSRKTCKWQAILPFPFKSRSIRWLVLFERFYEWINSSLLKHSLNKWELLSINIDHENNNH